MKKRSKNFKWLIVIFSLTILFSFSGCDFLGITGLDGADGIDGIDGTDGLDGVDGIDGEDGAAGLDGVDGADGLDGVDGADGLDGVDGVDGNTYPGGIVSININYSASLTPTSKLWIAFDPDTMVSDGDEYTLNLSLDSYIYESDGYSVNVFLPWQTIAIPDGSYYVYCWVDYIDNGELDEDEVFSGYTDLAGSNAGYIFSEGGGTGEVIISHSDGGPSAVFPTYTIGTGYVPQIDFLISDSILLN